MRNHLDLWSFKVDNNAITLNIIYKNMDVRKKFPRAKFLSGWLASSEGCELGSGINRREVSMPSIACEDASTHGKYIYNCVIITNFEVCAPRSVLA